MIQFRRNKLLNYINYIEITKDLVTHFKVKTASTKGARCEQAGKANSEKIFISLNIDPNILEKFKSFNQKIFCAAQELYLRLYDLQNKDKKRWFLNLSEALINDLI